MSKHLKDPHGRRALELAVELLEGRLVPYSEAVREALAEGEEAARQFVDAALSLDADASIRQLMPAITTMYDSRTAADPVLADPTSPVAGDVVVNDEPSADPVPVVEPADA